MAELLTSRIVKWNAEKGYGFVRVDSKDIFLHIKDFANRRKTPAVGDVIRFSQGADQKGRPCANEWRIPEATLQVLALCGGWPGAFIAQQRLRHKCSKPRFLVVFWMITAAYQLVAIDLLLNWRISQAIYGYYSEYLRQYL